MSPVSASENLTSTSTGPEFKPAFSLSESKKPAQSEQPEQSEKPTSFRSKLSQAVKRLFTGGQEFSSSIDRDLSSASPSSIQSAQLEQTNQPAEQSTNSAERQPLENMNQLTLAANLYYQTFRKEAWRKKLSRKQAETWANPVLKDFDQIFKRVFDAHTTVYARQSAEDNQGISNPDVMGEVPQFRVDDPLLDDLVKRIRFQLMNIGAQDNAAKESILYTPEMFGEAVDAILHHRFSDFAAEEKNKPRLDAQGQPLLKTENRETVKILPSGEKVRISETVTVPETGRSWQEQIIDFQAKLLQKEKSGSLSDLDKLDYLLFPPWIQAQKWAAEHQINLSQEPSLNQAAFDQFVQARQAQESSSQGAKERAKFSLNDSLREARALI